MATQGELLRDAIDASDLSVNELARLLTDGDTGKRRNNMRSMLYRWMKGGGISDPWAERLGMALDKGPDYFKKPRPEPEELDQLRSQAEALLRQVEQLQQRLSREAS
jgi:hypothetical protein